MKTVLILSGGLDSTVLLYGLLAEGGEVAALSFDYGQRNGKELAYARVTADAKGVEHRIADLSRIKGLFAGSSQTSSNIDVPEGHYADESMKATVVPNRNMVMLSIAAAWAISKKADRVAYAAHGGDHAIYPDCRKSFANHLGLAIGEADWHRVTLHTPYMDLAKFEIVQIGHDLGVPFDKTWSCYKGKSHHCGKCGTCVERRESFLLARVPDPTRYEE